MVYVIGYGVGTEHCIPFLNYLVDSICSFVTHKVFHYEVICSITSLALMCVRYGVEHNLVAMYNS